MADSNTFHRDSDCPAHDSRCTAELCIMQPEHPRHDEFLKWRERRGTGEPYVPLKPIYTLGDWEQMAATEWRRTDCWEDEVTIEADGTLDVRCDGTYGEGGGLTVPLDILRSLLDGIGMRIVPKD